MLELLSNASISMLHLSRFAEDLIFYNSGEAGFVEMSDGAEAAIAALNDTEVEGRKLVVNESRPRETR